MSVGIKKFTAVILAIAAVFLFCFAAAASLRSDTDALLAAEKEPFAETVKRITGKNLTADWVQSPEFDSAGVWFSYLDWQNELSDLDQPAFTKAVEGILADCAARGLDTVYLQLRAFGDAFYPSEIYPYSQYLGKTPDYDPLEIWLSLAEEYGIRIEGWINPFRLGKEKPDLDAKQAESGYYWLDPADEAAVEQILAGIDELCRTYPLAGLQIDDYFYSGVTPQAFGYDGETAREALTRFVKTVSERVEIPFGISPQGNFTADGLPKSDETLYTSLKEWCDSGYIDYLLPQVYYGFENESAPFDQTVDRWKQLTEGTDVTLRIGLAQYKCGKQDPYAGSGKDEWLAGDAVIQAQIESLCGRADGYALFRYGMLE